MEFKWFMVFLCVLAVCVTTGVILPDVLSGGARLCTGGVYDLAERSVGICAGARVTIEERGGKRYAVCSCEPAVPTADAGPDAGLVEQEAP
jgi:hypothetical protein